MDTPPGVTPVYTTFSGVTQLVGSSAVRIIFDSPYEGKSAYFSHMASGNQDFREVVNGQKAEAGVTKIGSQGDFGTNAGVHLHLSFDDGNPGSDLWPTLDPTEFFKARYLKYYLGWDHIGSSVTCSEGGKEVDVVLVIDSSGSMVDNDPANHRLAAGKAYLTASLAGDYVGVIDFDDNARVASPLLKLPDNKDTLSAAIDTINSSGGTNIGGGIQAACNELINSDSPNYVKAAILLTDGENDPPKPIDEHQCFIDRGWPLYIFGLGDADDNLLSQIAANTNGEYKRLPPSNFVCEFQAVRTKIGGGQPGPCTAIQIDPNETISIPVNVVQWLLKATFGISWPGSDVEMSLMSPSGRIIDRNTDDADVEHDSGATYETYSITNPEPGEWQVSLFGADVPVGGEEVVFNYATIDNPNPIDKTSNYLPLVLKAYQSGPPQIPTTTPTPPPDTSTPTPTSTPTSTPPQPPSASLSGMNQIDTCAWDVRMTLRNFAPNSQITVHSDYNEVVCDTGKIVSSSWTSGYGSPTDANGNLVVAYLHQGTGDYKYTFTDETGGQATLSFSTDPSPSDQIVFVSSRDGDNEVFIMSIDEANVEQLTNNSATDMNPIWFPNGNKLVFHSNRDGNNQIYTMNSNGSNQSRLLSSSTIDEWPQLSPDGNKIAFSRVADFDGAGLRSEVFVMDSNGSGVTRLTNTSGSNNGFNYGCWASGWSPDSLQILFYCYIDNYDQLLIMNANGNNQHKLTTDTHWNAIPSMSPDGTKIVYSSYRDGNYEIYVMNSNGTNQTRLTNNSVEEWRPTWSQDGSKIIFESKRAGETQIYWMSLDGSQQVRLTSNSAYNGQPNWRPD